MKENFDDNSTLRKYLLGLVGDEAVRDGIEERLMTDDAFFDELRICEDDLIEQYLDDELTSEERKCFDEHFLIPEDRRETLSLVSGLREIAAEPPTPETSDAKNLNLNFAPLFGWLRFASVTAVLVIACLAIWRLGIYESDAEKGVAQLRKAYEGQRLFEPRITVLPDYSPHVVTRGATVKLSDAAARDRAERYLLDGSANNADAAAHHALAVLNFAEKKFDRALDELKLALAAAPRDARVLSDAGAIYLELGQRAAADGDATKKYEYLNESLKNLDLAIAVDQKLSEPRFNRALCLTALGISERAREAWRQYLEIDSTSKWADEARRNLEALDKKQSQEISAADLETQFVAATGAGDEALAAALISGNRELIRGKYLPQRLAASYVGAPDARRNELLRALRYAGELELKTTGDTFANEIALFYATVDGDKFGVLTAAHAEIRDGHAKCLDQHFGDALTAFRSARQKFENAGDHWNAALASYFVGYALANVEQSAESIKVLSRVHDYAERHRYLWLDATVSYWIGCAEQKLQRHTSSRLSHAHALRIAEKIGDNYISQRNLVELARLNAFVGRRDEALGRLSQMFEKLSQQNNSRRQKYRNYAIATEMLSRLKLFHAARDLSLASVQLADELDDKMWMSASRSSAGSIALELGDNENARQLAAGAREAAEKIADIGTRNKALAQAAANLGELEARLGNFNNSAESYREAVNLYNSVEMPYFPEQANKGLVVSLSALGLPDETEKQIGTTLKNIESYRSQIRDIDEQRNFFDLRAGIYEMACEFETNRRNHEAAYNYAESARARTLLDSMQPDAERPLSLAEVRMSLPENVQLLQYALLQRSLLIWVVTRDKFTQHTLEITSSDLEREVGEFVSSISTAQNKAAHSGRSRALYDKLIAPVVAELDPAKELAIVPDKLLFALPFVALESADGKVLIEDFAILYSPSASVFIRCTKTAAEKDQSREESFLGFGNPAFDRDAFQDLPDLPSAKEEVETSASHYKSKRMFLRADAKTSTFLKASPQADVIHFAGHYVVAPLDPMSSHLLFAKDGADAESCVLTNRELASRSLSKTKLIVLAACQTGGETVYEGEGMVGLASVFLSADVPLVVASHWSVDSGATTRLMSRFHELRRSHDLSTTQALRAAQIEMLGHESGEFTDPFFWAGFAVFGGSVAY